jgi:hypothetical protein
MKLMILVLQTLEHPQMPTVGVLYYNSSAYNSKFHYK